MSEAKFKTMRHIETVRNFLGVIVKELVTRAELHDQSKLQPPESDILEVMTPKLRGLTYGSPEYRESMKAMKPMTEHHYAHNRHHVEYFKPWRCVHCKGTFTDDEAPPAFGKVEGDDLHEKRFCPTCCRGAVIYECELVPQPEGIDAMNLIDVLEMLVDWKAAGLRHHDGDIFKSIEINQKRYGFSDELRSLLVNTAEWMNGQPVTHHAEES